MYKPVKQPFPLNKVIEVELLNSQPTRVSALAQGRDVSTHFPQVDKSRLNIPGVIMGTEKGGIGVVLGL